MKITVEGECRVSDLVDFLGIKDRQIQELAKNGVIPKTKHGVFDFFEAVKAYITYLQSVVRSRAPNVTESSDLTLRKMQADVEEKEAKARKARYLTDVMEGKLLKLEDVSRQWAGRYVELKAEMLEFPKRVAFRFSNPDIRLRVEEEANTFVYELLTRYSREGIGPDSGLGTGDTAADAEAPKTDNRKRVGKRKQNS